MSLYKLLESNPDVVETSGSHIAWYKSTYERCNAVSKKLKLSQANS